MKMFAPFLHLSLAVSFPWPQVSSAGADPVGEAQGCSVLMEAQSVPLSLWAQQEINNVGTRRRFGSAFHCPFLEPLSVSVQRQFLRE